jgi:cell filamentation protein
LRGLDPVAFAQRLARLYGDLDHLHPFKEGNSRTLRAFTQQLAKHGGHVDWAGTGVDAASRDRLYIARDVAVTARAFAGLDQDRAMKTESRAEYEAFVQIVARYRNAPDLLTVVREAVFRERHLAAARSFREQPPADTLQAHPELAGAFAAKAAAVDRARADGLSKEQVDAVAARVASNIAAGLERGQFPRSNSADRRPGPGPAVKRPRDIER